LLFILTNYSIWTGARAISVIYNSIKTIFFDYLLDKCIENYAIMPSIEVMGFKERNFGGVSQHKGVPKTIFGRG
jgi:hypothetical protein